MNSRTSYKQRTKVFGIPVVGYEAIWPELELKKYTIIENLLLAATRGGTNAVFEEGCFSVISKPDGTFSVHLLATGAKCASSGICGGAYYRVTSTIEWADLQANEAYYLYLKTNPRTLEDPTSVRAISAKYTLKESSAILLAKIDLRGDKAVLDDNPPGKVNSKELAQHVIDGDNPHGEVLKQERLEVNNLVLKGNIEVDGEKETAIVPASELMDVLKGKTEVMNFKTLGHVGIELLGKGTVKFVSVSRVGSDFEEGLVGEVVIQYYGNRFVVKNTGDTGIPMKAFVVYE